MQRSSVGAAPKGFGASAYTTSNMRLGIACARRPKRSRWDIARRATEQISGRSAEFADAARDIIDRVKTIYEEGSRIAQDAGELWTRGRKLAGY